MALEDILALVANTGFPIVVASYLMVRMEARLDQLSQALAKLNHLLEKIG
ncbi:MAG: YvrJ family protein [Tissierellia bacterium]|nr:YvrJ family protein [Tissierellia bacterium]